MWLFYVWIDLFDTRPTLLQSAYQKSVGIRPRVLRPTWPGGAPLYPRTLRGPLSAYWYQRWERAHRLLTLTISRFPNLRSHEFFSQNVSCFLLKQGRIIIIIIIIIYILSFAFRSKGPVSFKWLTYLWLPTKNVKDGIMIRAFRYLRKNILIEKNGPMMNNFWGRFFHVFWGKKSLIMNFE